jgi:hypothetical protein
LFEARIVDGFFIIKYLIAHSQGVDGAFNRFFFFNGGLDSLNLVVRVNTNIKFLGAKSYLDGNNVEISNESGVFSDARRINSL